MNNDLHTFLSQFVNFSPNELEAISAQFITRTIKKNAFLLKAGEVSKDFIFVKSGCIRMYYLSNGIEISAWFSLNQSIAMEVQSFISQCPSVCYLQATEQSEVAVLQRSRLEKLYQVEPKMQELMRKIWEAALVLVIPRFLSLQNDSAEKRYLDLIQNPELIQQIPQKYLASFIGVTPTSLSRIRKKIAKH